MNRPKALVVLALFALAGCSILSSDDELYMTAEVHGSHATPGEPISIEVTANNISDGRIAWGRGSSSCMLGLVVRIGRRDHPAVHSRICTADLAPHALDRGEFRVETLEWDGMVRVGDEQVRLEPGVYELRGAAGDEYRSPPVEVILTAPGS